MAENSSLGLHCQNAGTSQQFQDRGVPKVRKFFDELGEDDRISCSVTRFRATVYFFYLTCMKQHNHLWSNTMPWLLLLVTFVRHRLHALLTIHFTIASANVHFQYFKSAKTTSKPKAKGKTI